MYTCRIIYFCFFLIFAISCQRPDPSPEVDLSKLALSGEQVSGTESYVLANFQAGELAKWIEYQLVPYYEYQTQEVNESYYKRIPVTSEDVLLNIPSMGNYMLLGRSVSEDGQTGEVFHLPIVGAPIGFEVLELSAICCRYRVRIFDENMQVSVNTEHSAQVHTQEEEGVMLLGDGYPNSTTYGYVQYFKGSAINEYNFRLYSGDYDSEQPLPDEPSLEIVPDDLYRIELLIEHAENTVASLCDVIPESVLEGQTPEAYLEAHPEALDLMEYYMDSWKNLTFNLHDGTYVVMVVPMNKNGKEGIGHIATQTIKIKDGIYEQMD